MPFRIGIEATGRPSPSRRCGGFAVTASIAGGRCRRLRMPLLRHRDVLLAATKIDMDEWIADPLIKFCAAFTDQGFRPVEAATSRSGILRGLFPALS